MDAVIAWVDGSDPAHAAKRQAAMQRLGMGDAQSSNVSAATRFSDMGEVYYCVASILKYAPFIRRIHIVADDQAPAQIGEFAAQGICAPDRIRMVDHREIFRDHLDALPSFNSQGIEALVWNIDGLDEQFLYFNDDFFLNAPLALADLMTADGKLRLTGRLQSVGAKLMRHRLRKALGRLRGRKIAVHSGLAQAKAAQMLGLRQYLPVTHLPRVMRTSTLRDWFAAHPQALRDQLRDPFRNADQFLPNALANHLEIEAGRAVIGDEPPSVYLTPRNGAETDRQIAQIEAGRLPYGCIQSLDEFAPERRARLRAAMARKFAGFLPEGLALP